MASDDGCCQGQVVICEVLQVIGIAAFGICQLEGQLHNPIRPCMIWISGSKVSSVSPMTGVIAGEYKSIIIHGTQEISHTLFLLTTMRTDANEHLSIWFFSGTTLE